MFIRVCNILLNSHFFNIKPIIMVQVLGNNSRYDHVICIASAKRDSKQNPCITSSRGLLLIDITRVPALQMSVASQCT